MPKQRGRWANSFLQKAKKRKIDPNRAKAKIKTTARGYSSNRDPYRVFSTKAQADADAVRLKGIVKKRNNRVTTFYTMLQDKRKGTPTNKFPNVPQGPHTIPHYYTLDALVNARDQGRLKEIAALRLKPADFKRMVDEEIPAGHVKRARAEVAIERYKRLYRKTRPLLKSLRAGTLDEAGEITLTHTLNKALQMHPYQTYAYKGGGASKAALSYKNENRSVAVKVDLPAKKVFSDMAAAKGVIGDLLGQYEQFQT